MIHIRDNDEAKTDSPYDTFHKRLGHRYKISYRIIQVLRSHFYMLVPDFSKLDDNQFQREIIKLRKKFEGSLVRMEECLRPKKIQYAMLVLKDEINLNKTRFRVVALEKTFGDLVGSIKKVTFRKAIIRHLKYLETNQDQLKEMLEIQINNKEEDESQKA